MNTDNSEMIENFVKAIDEENSKQYDEYLKSHPEVSLQERLLDAGMKALSCPTQEQYCIGKIVAAMLTCLMDEIDKSNESHRYHGDTSGWKNYNEV